MEKIYIEVIQMMRKVSAILILIIIFLISAPTYAAGSPFAEIYDPAQKKVVKTVQVNSELYTLTNSILKSIDNYYGRITPSKVEGYKVRIPLDPPIKVSKNSLNSKVSEVYIIIPQNKSPIIMIFEDKNKPSYFKFHGSIESLSKALDFKF
jgi:hypothetical protein